MAMAELVSCYVLPELMVASLNGITQIFLKIFFILQFTLLP